MRPFLTALAAVVVMTGSAMADCGNCGCRSAGALWAVSLRGHKLRSLSANRKAYAARTTAPCSLLAHLTPSTPVCGRSAGGSRLRHLRHPDGMYRTCACARVGPHTRGASQVSQVSLSWVLNPHLDPTEPAPPDSMSIPYGYVSQPNHCWLELPLAPWLFTPGFGVVVPAGGRGPLRPGRRGGVLLRILDR
jgi:hypothetical protein